MRGSCVALAVLCLVGGPPLAAPARGAIALDLSYVDQGSPAFARFRAFVDEAVAGNPGYGFSATDAVYMYRLTGGVTYASLAIATVEAQVQAAEQAIAAAERPEIAFDSYLYVGGMLRDLALVYDWCGPLLSASQKARWSAYAEQAVWNVWHHEQASWGGHPFPWSGWSTDNPGNNYYYSFLEATMYWAFASGSGDWQSFLATQKIPPLVAYFQQLAGGGSREGTGYGVSHARLFEVYRLWRDQTGEDLGALSSHLADSIDYWRHATLPTLDQYAPIGDQARVSEPWLFDYHRHLVLAARAMAESDPVAGRAAWWLHRIAVGQMQHGFNFRDDLLPAGTTESVPTTLWHHATGVGHLFARSSWTSDALWLAFVAGPYEESHAHQDQGAFTLFRDDWLAVTENIHTHSGIQQGTEVHDVVRFVDGDGQTVPQRNSTSTVAVRSAGDVLEVSADLSPAYAGSERVSAWHRDLQFDPTGLTVHDTFAVVPGVTAVFQVNTPNQPQIAGRTAVAGALRVTVLAPAEATLSALEWRSVDPSEYLSGWKLEVRGSGAEFLVRLDVGSNLFGDRFETGDARLWSRRSP